MEEETPEERKRREQKQREFLMNNCNKKYK